MNLSNPYESPSFDPRDSTAADEVVNDGAPSAQPGEGERWGWLHSGLLAISTGYVYWSFPGLRWRLEGWEFLRFEVLAVLAMLLTSGGVAAILLAAVRKWQRVPTFPVHFGHWLMLIAGTNTLAHQLNRWIPLQAMKAELHKDEQRELFSDPLAAVPTMQLAVSLAALIVPWLAIRFSPGEKNWQRFGLFWICFQVCQIALFYFEQTIHWLTLPLNLLLSGLMAGTFLLAVVSDLRRQRDQLHWIGIIWIVLTLFVLRILVPIAMLPLM